MKTFTHVIALLVLTHIDVFSQGNMTIRGGGAVTVNGNTTITLCGSPITDTRDGKIYSTVLIGDQCWMAQNLNIGTRINGSLSQTNNDIIEKYCYNDDENNCNTYGALYQWDEAMLYLTTEGVQGICPTGWHLPTDAEWTTLTTFLGGESISGGKMKSIGTVQAGTGLWNDPNYGATNSSGFTALPAGDREQGGNFNLINQNEYFWSSSQYSTFSAWWRCVTYFRQSTDRGNSATKHFGFSVRCVHD